MRKTSQLRSNFSEGVVGRDVNKIKRPSKGYRGTERLATAKSCDQAQPKGTREGMVFLEISRNFWNQERAAQQKLLLYMDTATVKISTKLGERRRK